MKSLTLSRKYAIFLEKLEWVGKFLEVSYPKADACEDVSLNLKYLGWTKEEALETRLRLESFEEDWNAPGMEAYDKL